MKRSGNMKTGELVKIVGNVVFVLAVMFVVFCTVVGVLIKLGVL